MTEKYYSLDIENRIQGDPEKDAVFIGEIVRVVYLLIDEQLKKHIIH